MVDRRNDKVSEIHSSTWSCCFGLVHPIVLGKSSNPPSQTGLYRTQKFWPSTISHVATRRGKDLCACCSPILSPGTRFRLLYVSIMRSSRPVDDGAESASAFPPSQSACKIGKTERDIRSLSSWFPPPPPPFCSSSMGNDICGIWNWGSPLWSLMMMSELSS